MTETDLPISMSFHVGRARGRDVRHGGGVGVSGSHVCEVWRNGGGVVVAVGVDGGSRAPDARGIAVVLVEVARGKEVVESAAGPGDVSKSVLESVLQCILKGSEVAREGGRDASNVVEVAGKVAMGEEHARGRGCCRHGEPMERLALTPGNLEKEPHFIWPGGRLEWRARSIANIGGFGGIFGLSLSLSLSLSLAAA